MSVRTRLDALYAQEKVACDMGRSAKTDEERQYYKEELKKIRTEIDDLTTGGCMNVKKWKIVCGKKSDYLKIADAMYDDNFTYIQKGPKKPIKFLGDESVAEEVRKLANKLGIECSILDIEKEKKSSKNLLDIPSNNKIMFDDCGFEPFPDLPSIEEYNDLPYALRDDFSSLEEEFFYKIRSGVPLTEYTIASLVNSELEIHRESSQISSILQTSRQVTSIVKLMDATFAIEWTESLSDMGTDKFENQPYEVEQVKQWVPIRKPRQFPKENREEVIEEAQER